VEHAHHHVFVKTHERGVVEGGRGSQAQQVPGSFQPTPTKVRVSRKCWLEKAGVGLRKRLLNR
jgi:hypothetical protein